MFMWPSREPLVSKNACFLYDEDPRLAQEEDFLAAREKLLLALEMFFLRQTKIFLLRKTKVFLPLAQEEHLLPARDADRPRAQE